MLLDRLLEDIQSCLDNQPVFVLPLFIIDEIVFHAAEPNAVAAEHVACFQAMTQMPVEEEFIAIR